MVAAVRGGTSMQATARQFRVSVSTVSFWVERVRQAPGSGGFSDGKPGFAWNRTNTALEKRILALRGELRNSLLGECGAPRIREALEHRKAKQVPSVATIGL